MDPVNKTEPNDAIQTGENTKLVIAQAAKTEAHTYDPNLADEAVRFRNLFLDRRFWHVTKTLLMLMVKGAYDKVREPRLSDKSHQAKSAIASKRAGQLREALVALGPTFIKLGQFLSVRRDFMPVEISDELALLQDRVPPFDIELVRQQIKTDLGAWPEEIFKDFDPVPMASASIGQVHRARLLNSHQVVVKVQRPDLAQRFYQDLGYMRMSVKLGRLIKPNGDWDAWDELSDEFGRHLFAEINYLEEGRNADRMRRVLRGHTEVKVPRVYWKYTGRKVLTLEYVPGVKISQVEKLKQMDINLGKLGNQLMSVYLEQVLFHGFFHADPHAGNLSIHADGSIVMYDFGMMGEITQEQRDALIGCMSCVIKKDSRTLVKHLTSLGIIRPGLPNDVMARTLEPFIDYYAGKELKELDFTDLEHDIDEIVVARALTLPANLAYVLRAGSSLEGIARTLKANFSFVEAAKPTLKRWILSRTFEDPSQAALVLKLLYQGTLTKGEDAILNLTTGKSDADSSSHADSHRQSKSSNGNRENGNSKTDLAKVAQADEIEKLRQRVYLLETQIKELSNRQKGTLVALIGLIALSLAAAIANSFPEYRYLCQYFLIGNGVMVAIIIRRFVIPVIRMGRLAGTGRTRGGDKRC